MPATHKVWQPTEVEPTMTAEPQLDISSIVTHSTNQVACELDGETVLMHIDTGEYFGCDEIGSRIWKLLEEPRSVSAICDVLQQEFDVQRQPCEQDVLAFLKELASESLIEVKNSNTD